MKRKYKSVITKRIFRSIRKLSVVLFLLSAALSLGKISSTNSFFMDTASMTGATITVGYWIPELTISVNPESPDGDNGWYKTSPCITLSATIGGDSGGSTIYYEFSNDGDPIAGGDVYPGTCIPVPEGEWDFQAQAVNDLDSSWVSNIVTGNFKVDTVCPVVEITNPDDGDELNGTVEVRGTIIDDNPDHYWLVIENSSGTKVAGPGTVNDTSSFTDKKFFDWDTTEVADGEYTIKLEARDEAGNKSPTDSVDWIDVTVNNTNPVNTRDVVINEVMWMGSFGHNSDEWIELRNTTDHEIDIGQWEIENARHSGNNKIQIPASKSIPADGYFLIANYPKTSSKSELNADVDVVNNDISLYDDDNSNLILRDRNNNIIDQAKGNHHWPAGWHGIIFHMSMERNKVPGDGLDSGSWHTCVDHQCNSTTYWDHEDGNFGTPGYPNLSVNDPSDPEYDPAFMEQQYLDAQETDEPDENDETAGEKPDDNPAADGATNSAGTEETVTEPGSTVDEPKPEEEEGDSTDDSTPVIDEKPDPQPSDTTSEDATQEEEKKDEEVSENSEANVPKDSDEETEDEEDDSGDKSKDSVKADKKSEDEDTEEDKPVDTDN